MPRELPNLDWLRVFAATAESESFALAASELGVTPGAVSQRIKAFEAFLGIDLFQRYAQGVRLTDAGKRYARRVVPHLEQLALATREITAAADTRSVRVTILPALAQLWLGPRMDHFHKLHTNTTVEIWADPNVIDMRTSNFDLAIRYGKPPFPGCDYRPLLFDELVPVASPALIEASGTDEHGFPRDARLLADSYWENDLNDWLAATGQTRPRNLITHTFSLYSMAIDATLNGRGFIIGHTSLIGGLVAEGQLQTLSDRRRPAENQFYLLTRSGMQLSEAAETFVEWLVDQAEPTQR
jgi:LysR family glycine cleavage system transcriptional activator